MIKAFKAVAVVLAAVILVVGGYVAYVFLSFHRLGDMPIDVNKNTQAAIENQKDFEIVSYNIGFGAYESDYGFFMDGGDQSWAWSKDRLDKNLKNISNLLSGLNADFYFIQEVDIDSTRSYHVDEREYLTASLNNMDYTFAQNYDSPFLFYPFVKPHGASKSGLMVFSSYSVSSAQRVELPIEEGFTKFLDLDRCYSKNRIALPDGKELVMYNFHLSAYTSDGTIANEQLEIVLSDIQKEYESGNYCIAGGDFNKDILGDSSVYFGKADKEYTWAQPIPEGILEKFDVSLVAPLDEENPVPTCRNADSAYHEGQYVLTIDGFLVTPNVEVKSSEVIDTGFAYSDHNPVSMSFSLK
ncbi:MAG: endonuclease/exonuclease/phosphatase family protein [Clostridia bacterium]|nr:endonuclease/exonuclease/phosphatase family protein [Clostridia bacterium]